LSGNEVFWGFKGEATDYPEAASGIAELLEAEMLAAKSSRKRIEHYPI
jgi:hypothetical protein